MADRLCASLASMAGSNVLEASTMADRYSAYAACLLFRSHCPCSVIFPKRDPNQLPKNAKAPVKTGTATGHHDWPCLISSSMPQTYRTAPGSGENRGRGTGPVNVGVVLRCFLNERCLSIEDCPGCRWSEFGQEEPYGSICVPPDGFPSLPLLIRGCL